MANTIEFILSAVDKMSPTLEKVQSTTGKAVGFMEKNWVKVGAATAAAGVALEGFVKSQAPLLEGSRKLAESLNLTEKEMINLVTETSNVTFSLNDVIGVMEIGRQQGIESAKELQNYANFWDLISDATGESSVALAKSSSALRAVGIEAGKEGEALAALGYIQQETTGSISEFLLSVGRMGPELRELGLDINDTAALLGAMERELGMTSRVARTEFTQAVNQSNGDIGELLKNLGLTNEQFEQYRKKVSESSGVMEEFARINNETMFTSLDKVKQVIAETSLKIAPYIEEIAKLAPALMLVGPAMKIFVGAHQAMTWIMSGALIPAIQSAIVWLKSMYAVILANPFTIWIAAIGAVIGAVVLLYKNWEKVVNFISNSLDWLAEKFGILAKPINWLKEKLGLVKDEAEETVEAVENVGNTVEETTGKFDESAVAMENAEEMARLLAEANYDLGDSFEEAGTKAEEATKKYDGAVDSMGQNVGHLVELANKSTESWEDFYAYWEAEAEYKSQSIKKQFDEVVNHVEEAVKKSEKKVQQYAVKSASGQIMRVTTQYSLSAEEREAGYKIEKLHTGGIYRSPTPGGEGLVWLKDRETVRTPAQEKALQSGASIVISQGAIVINTQRLDDREINRVGDKLMDVIISKSRAYNLRFGR